VVSLQTTAGEMSLEETELAIADRSWKILHGGSAISFAQEREYLSTQPATLRPYGIVLWPAAIALAHDLASRDLAGKRVLELGAGTGLPGIVAATRGANVLQTDRQSLALNLCKQNAERNGVGSIAYRVADWTAWNDDARYDLIVGADILYAEALHANLQHIFEISLAPGGVVVLADPFRGPSLRLLQGMEAGGWNVTMDKWTVSARSVGVYAVTKGLESRVDGSTGPY
jgi:methyltransferase-like protein 23